MTLLRVAMATMAERRWLLVTKRRLVALLAVTLLLVGVPPGVVYSQTAPDGMVTYQENDPDHTGYAGWLFYENASLSGKYSAFATNRGDIAEFSFKGTSIVWKTAMFPDSGKTEVYLDGVYKKTFDGYASSPQYNVTGYAKSGLVNGRHTIRLVLVGQNNANSEGIYNDLDRFIAGGKTFQENSPQITYGSWTGVVEENALGGSYRYSRSTIVPAYFYYFTGPQVDVITAKGPSRGKVTIRVINAQSGEVVRTVRRNLHASTEWQAAVSITDLNLEGKFYLEVRSADGRPVVVDAYRAYPFQEQQTLRAASAEPGKPELSWTDAGS